MRKTFTVVGISILLSIVVLSSVSACGKSAEEEAESLFDRAVAYYDKGEYYKATAEFGKVIELQPDSATAYYNQGLRELVNAA